MTNKYYTYNPDKDLFTEVKRKPTRRIVKSLAYFFTLIVTALLFHFFMTRNYPTPNELALRGEFSQLQEKYLDLQQQVGELTTVLDNVFDRDAQVYSLLLGSMPVSDHLWHGGIGGHQIEGKQISGEVNLKALEQSIDELERKIVLHSKYIDGIETMASEKDERLSHIPSIRPIKMDKSDSYLRLLSGYGMRMHPVHKVQKMHRGLDFPAPTGTPVVATGEGRVVKVSSSRSGYGRCVVIDHGFGYESLYAHLDEITVKKGDEVTRGQHLGTVGRTGTATAPHVHYEVRYNNRPVNPISFCMDGLSPDEFQKLVEAASVQNNSFD